MNSLENNKLMQIYRMELPGDTSIGSVCEREQSCSYAKLRE